MRKWQIADFPKILRAASPAAPKSAIKVSARMSSNAGLESKFSRSAAFVDVVVIYPGLDVGPIAEAVGAFFFFEFGAA